MPVPRCRTNLTALLPLVLAACMHAVPLKADDPKWFAEVLAGKSVQDVRATIDGLLERNEHWSRGAHGLVYQDGSHKEGVACSRIEPDLEIGCDDEEKICEVNFERNDRTFGEHVSLEEYSYDEAQLLHAMLLRFCGWREPAAAP